MVIGMVKIIAREFYNLSVEITLEEEVVDESSALPYHYKLAIEMTGKKDSQAVGSMCLHSTSNSFILIEQCAAFT